MLFAKQDADWYSAGIYKLILRYNKCLNEQRDFENSTIRSLSQSALKTEKWNEVPIGEVVRVMLFAIRLI